MKAAKAEWFAFIVTTHWPKPLQSPAQPLKVDPPSGVAVRVTVAPLAKSPSSSRRSRSRRDRW